MTQAPGRSVATRLAVGQVVDPLDLGETVKSFLRTLEGRNASAETIRAYTTSLTSSWSLDRWALGTSG